MLALDVLDDVFGQGLALDDAFDRHAPMAGSDGDGRDDDVGALTTRDRSFARLVVATTVRRRGRIEAVVGQFLDRPLPAKARRAQLILWMATAQVLFLDTPAHAGVSAHVSLARRGRDTRHFASLINAVLRRVSEQGGDVLAQMSALDDWPAWLTGSWRQAYGAPRAAAIAAASGQEAPLDLSVKATAGEAERVAGDWAERLGGVALGGGTVRVAAGGLLSARAGFAEGAWWVQDAAAALPVQLLGDVSGLKVLDLCAAPGGKTLQLAARGAVVTAVDQSEARLRRLHENLARTDLGEQVRVVVRDGRDLAGLGPFDAILVDAPCTATGTLRRRPDVAWARKPGDAAALARVQAALIKAAYGVLKPGGRMVFCTCSLQAEEGRGPVDLAVDQAISDGSGLVLDPIGHDELPAGAPAPLADGTLRTFPDDMGEAGGMDGFFMARLVKRA